MMKRIVIPLACLLVTTGAHGNTLKSLDEAVESGAEETYPIIRCAAFHFATAEWSGEKRLGSDTFQYLMQHVGLLVLATAKARSETHETTLEYEVEVARNDVRRIADLYRARFENNYARDGHAMLNDAVWNADLEACKIE